MAPTRYVKEPPVFDVTTKDFSHWKISMINYFNILEVWDIVEKGYEPKYDKTTNQLTIESKIAEEENLCAENAILSSIGDSVKIEFDNMTNAHDMWKALINRYEGNDQIKKKDLDDSSEVSTSFINEVNLELENIDYESEIELTTECIEIDDTSTVLNDGLIYQNEETRLRYLLDESNKTLLENDCTIGNLRFKILELESKVKEYESDNCKSHLEEKIIKNKAFF